MRSMPVGTLRSAHGVSPVRYVLREAANARWDLRRKVRSKSWSRNRTTPWHSD